MKLGNKKNVCVKGYIEIDNETEMEQETDTHKGAMNAAEFN